MGHLELLGIQMIQSETTQQPSHKSASSRISPAEQQAKLSKELREVHRAIHPRYSQSVNSPSIRASQRMQIAKLQQVATTPATHPNPRPPAH